MADEMKFKWHDRSGGGRYFDVGGYRGWIYTSEATGYWDATVVTPSGFSDAYRGHKTIVEARDWCERTAREHAAKERAAKEAIQRLGEAVASVSDEHLADLIEQDKAAEKAWREKGGGRVADPAAAAPTGPVYQRLPDGSTTAPMTGQPPTGIISDVAQRVFAARDDNGAQPVARPFSPWAHAINCPCAYCVADPGKHRALREVMAQSSVGSISDMQAAARMRSAEQQAAMEGRDYGIAAAAGILEYGPGTPYPTAEDAQRASTARRESDIASLVAAGFVSPEEATSLRGLAKGESYAKLETEAGRLRARVAELERENGQLAREAARGRRGKR